MKQLGSLVRSFMRETAQKKKDYKKLRSSPRICEDAFEEGARKFKEKGAMFSKGGKCKTK